MSSTIDGQHPGAFPSFEAVQALAGPALEALLRTGDGPERVWAAWSLGLREGAGAIPALEAAAGATPDAGVRATLAVILAGHGRRDILAVLAADDPDADVRASACRHLAGTSLPELTWVRDFLEHRLRIDRATAVQIVLLDLVLDGHLSIEPEQLADSLAQPELRVRQRAAEIAYSLWARDGAMCEGFPILLDDADPEIRQSAHDVAVERLGPAGFVTMVAETTSRSPEIIVWHLGALARQRLTVPWSAMAPLASDVAGIDEDLIPVLADGDPASRPWLLHLAAGDDWVVRGLARPKLVPLLTGPPLSPSEVTDAERLRRRLDEDLRAEPDEPEEWMDADDLEDWERWTAATRDFRDEVDRAIAGADGKP